MHIRSSGQTNIINIIFMLAMVAVLSASILKLPSTLPIVIGLSFFVFLLAFTKTDVALTFLIFSMLLSPELKLGATLGRDIVIRMDDIFLFVVFLGWLAKLAVHKELGLLKSNPLNKPLLVYILISVVATLFGFLRGYARLHISMFYLLKYFEYYLIFFMVINNLRDERQSKTFVFFMIFVALIISIYACIMHFRGVERVTAPFEGKVGEANTLGGYLILIIMLATALLINLPSLKQKLFLLIVLLFALPALIFTLSRGSWLGFIPAAITLIILARKGKTVLLVSLLLVALLYPVIFPRFFFERINYTFVPGRHYQIMGRGITLEDSAAARIEILQGAFKKWIKEPILGYGVGSPSPILDNQYARLLLEVGLVGILGFMWIIIAIFKNALRNLVELGDDDFASGLITGFIAGLVGLLVHALSSETFILIRIMEPFWFLTAIVMMLPQIKGDYGDST